MPVSSDRGLSFKNSPPFPPVGGLPMRSLVVSYSAHDPLVTTLKSALRPLIDQQEPASASFDNAENAYFQTEADLVVVVLPHNAEQGLEVIGRLRANIRSHLLVVGKASEPKLILRALQVG